MAQERRSVIVTHASEGIGRSTAVWLAERGVCVLAGATTIEGMTDLPRETGRGGILEITALDMNSEHSCAEAITRAETLFGPLYGVVHTGAIDGVFGPSEELSDATIHALFENNLFAPLRLIRLVTPILRRQSRGHIICVSSAAGRVALPLTGAYSASQYALEGWCDALRLELRDRGVHVSLIEPGLVRRGVVSEAKEAPSAETMFQLNPASPYQELATHLADAFWKLMPEAATPPEVADVIGRVLLDTAHPKPRYTVRRRTAAFLAARKLLPDRLLDSRLAKAIGL